MNEPLLTKSELPDGFAYPALLLSLVESGMGEFAPWKLLTGDQLREVKSGLAQRYPASGYVPFANRVDNDGVACWEPGNHVEVVIVHDFASEGWEVEERLPNFEAWFRGAMDDFIEHES